MQKFFSAFKAKYGYDAFITSQPDTLDVFEVETAEDVVILKFLEQKEIAGQTVSLFDISCQAWIKPCFDDFVHNKLESFTNGEEYMVFVFVDDTITEIDTHKRPIVDFTNFIFIDTDSTGIDQHLWVRA